MSGKAPEPRPDPPFRRNEKVQVFGCGVQKSGTTSLFDYLCQHADLSKPNQKELHFFDNEAIDWTCPDYDQLHNAFAPAEDASIRFEVTPSYIFWPQALERLKIYNPDARLIFLFRDPFERAWSHWCMEYARKTDTMLFGDAIRSYDKRMADNRHNPRARLTYSYLERGFYGAQVEHALTLFPREQLLFLKSDDLARNHTDVLERISAFLGIRPFPASPAVTLHTRRNTDYPCRPTADDLAYFRSRLAWDLSWFTTLAGIDISAWPTRNGHFVFQ